MGIRFKNLLPLLVLVLYPGRASADIIHIQQAVDLGVIAVSAMISGSVLDGPGSGAYTYEALKFIGPNLGVVINGQTVASILANNLTGSENLGTFGFNFPFGGAAGTLGSLQAQGFSVDASGTVQIPVATYLVTGLAFGNTVIGGPPVGNQIQNLNVLDAANILNLFEAAGLLQNQLPGPVIDGLISPVSSPITYNLGSNISSATQGADTIITTTRYMGEAVNTAYQLSADFGPVNSGNGTPEPGTGPMLSASLLALGCILFRRRS